MSHLSRRDFLGASAAALAAGPAIGRAAAEPPEAAKIAGGGDLVTLGKTDVQTSLLGLGTGTFSGREQRELGFDGFTRLVRHAFDRGVRYIDTADGYQTHPYVRQAIRGLPREKLFIQSKVRSRDPAAARADIERFRKELDTDYIDSLLIHYMTKTGWQTDMRPLMDVLSQAKDKGHVRAVGVSCHGMDPLVEAVLGDWVDVHLVRINPYGVKMDGQPDAVADQIKRMRDKGRGVIGMKIFGESGYKSPDERRKSLQYVLGLGTVQAFTIGFTSTAQIDETLGMIEKTLACHPLGRRLVA